MRGTSPTAPCPEHYPVVGSALIGAMAEVAGSAWRSTSAEAWGRAFGIVAGAMIEGAESTSLAAAAA